ncbi:hypothetical protein FJ208_01555 [Candidatus Gribaldobacteria bacterium]|nr:hypothetical protein [Candidatus Gribaldobacteria bacterium]
MNWPSHFQDFMNSSKFRNTNLTVISDVASDTFFNLWPEVVKRSRWPERLERLKEVVFLNLHLVIDSNKYRYKCYGAKILEDLIASGRDGNMENLLVFVFSPLPSLREAVLISQASDSPVLPILERHLNIQFVSVAPLCPEKILRAADRAYF